MTHAWFYRRLLHRDSPLDYLRSQDDALIRVTMVLIGALDANPVTLVVSFLSLAITWGAFFIHVDMVTSAVLYFWYNYSIVALRWVLAVTIAQKGGSRLLFLLIDFADARISRFLFLWEVGLGTDIVWFHSLKSWLIAVRFLVFLRVAFRRYYHNWRLDAYTFQRLLVVTLVGA